MPGLNHDIVASFMDEIPISLREAAVDLIHFSSLKDMLEMRLNEPSEFLQQRFNLNEQQWRLVLNAVILTKVSYFDVQLHFPNRYIDKLIEIACFANDMPDPDPVKLYRAMHSTHPHFSRWIKAAIQVKQQNIRYQNKNRS